MKEKIARFYALGLYSDEDMRALMLKGVITGEEFAAITGMED